MKYVRNVEDLKKFTFQFFDSFLSQNLSDQMVNNFLLGLKDNEGVNSAIEITKQKTLDFEAVAEYGEVVLQLNNYKPLLKKFVEFLLLSKQFEPICAFLNRIFLQQIGDVKYKSVHKTYSIKQRYFDRFVEIIMYCEIDKKIFTPFFLAIFNAPAKSLMNDYKEPLKEYLDIFLKEGEDDDFISQLLSVDKKNGISEYANTSTIKTLNVLLQGFVDNEITNSSIIKKAILNHEQESFNIIESLLQNPNEEIRFKATQLLLFLKDDRRVKDRIKYLYENTSDQKIKTLLRKECNFKSLESFSSKTEFDNYVEKSVLQIQERLYGARLKRYYQKYQLDNTGLSGKTLTFVMETFKNRDADNQLLELRDYFKFVGKNVLNRLSNVVFEVAVYRNRLLNSKWALRLIALFGSFELINEVGENLKVWFVNKKTHSASKYIIGLLSQCSRNEIIDICKNLLELNLDKKQIKFLEKKLKEFSFLKNQNPEEVKDKLAFDLGFDSEGTQIFNLGKRKILVKINIDCSLSLFNQKTSKPARVADDIFFENKNFKKLLKELERGVKAQRKRLLSAFLEFRNFEQKAFKECIIDNNLLNFLSKNLIWARYKKDKLLEICVLKDNALVHLTGNFIAENAENYTIALLQPIDCRENKDRLKDMIGQTLFDQLDFPVFDKTEILQNANYVESLSGVFCNARLFITRLQKIKYKINDLDSQNTYSTLIKENKNLNLLTTIEFDKVELGKENCSTTLSKIRFYDLNKLYKNGKVYNLIKSEAKIIKDMDIHIFSNEVAQIFIACKS